MTADELNAAMTNMRLQPKDLRKLTGVRGETVWKWRNGKLPVPTYVVTILTGLERK